MLGVAISNGFKLVAVHSDRSVCVYSSQKGQYFAPLTTVKNHSTATVITK